VLIEIRAKKIETSCGIPGEDLAHHIPWAGQKRKLSVRADKRMQGTNKVPLAKKNKTKTNEKAHKKDQ